MGLTSMVTRLRGRDYIGPFYIQMHKDGGFKGTSWQHKYQDFERCIPDLASKTIIDYGCGPLGGLAQKLGDKVISYDPYVEKFSTPPWDKPADVVFSSDVLEHMTWPDIQEFLGQARRTTAEYIFLIVSTRRASKLLPNGSNAHLMVKPGEWWLKRVKRELGEAFRPIYARADLIRPEVILCFQRERK